MTLTAINQQQYGERNIGGSRVSLHSLNQAVDCHGNHCQNVDGRHGQKQPFQEVKPGKRPSLVNVVKICQMVLQSCTDKIMHAMQNGHKIRWFGTFRGMKLKNRNRQTLNLLHRLQWYIFFIQSSSRVTYSGNYGNINVNHLYSFRI